MLEFLSFFFLSFLSETDVELYEKTNENVVAVVNSESKALGCSYKGIVLSLIHI